MPTPLQEMKCVLCCNKTKWLERGQRRYREAFGEDPYIYFKHSFMRHVVFAKGKFYFTAKRMDGI
jgi:hypothetical protein